MIDTPTEEKVSYRSDHDSIKKMTMKRVLTIEHVHKHVRSNIYLDKYTSLIVM